MEKTMRVVKQAQVEVNRQRGSGPREWWASKTPEERSEILRQRAVKQWETKKGEDGMQVRKWVVKPSGDVDAVYTAFVEAYEARYRRKLRGVALQAEVRGNLSTLVTRVGAEEALVAVRVLFTSPKLKWVSSRLDQFLANKKTYEGHVARVLSERPAGEQSEWRGPELTASKQMTPDEFAAFGR